MLSVSLIDDDSKMIDFFRKTTLEMSDVVCIRVAKSIEEYLAKPLKSKNKHFLFLDIHLENNISIS